MTSDYREQFDKTVDALLENIDLIVGEDRSKLVSYKLMLNVAKMTGLHIDYFYNAISPYKTQILERDEKFFTEKATNDTSLSESIGLIDHWNKLNDKNKDIIWEYVTILYVYSCYSKDLYEEAAEIYKHNLLKLG